MDCNPPGSSVHGISQAGIWEWVAISFSRGILSLDPSIWGLNPISCIAGGFFTDWATNIWIYVSSILLFIDLLEGRETIITKIRNLFALNHSDKMLQKTHKKIARHHSAHNKAPLRNFSFAAAQILWVWGPIFKWNQERWDDIWLYWSPHKNFCCINFHKTLLQFLISANVKVISKSLIQKINSKLKISMCQTKSRSKYP